MKASRQLLSHWRRCSMDQLESIYRSAQLSVEAFETVTRRSGSSIQAWVRGAPVVEYEHYPDNDVVDRRTGFQFYYHAHRHGSGEHGHLHLFWHATRSGRRRRLAVGRRNWVRTSPTHLFAISLNPMGLPTSFFTVNQWVTDGYWFEGKTLSRWIEDFSIAQRGIYGASCQWLTNFVHMYRPAIDTLLRARDARIAKGQGHAGSSLVDRRLEVLSSMTVDWMADLNALEALIVRRKRATAGPV